MIQDISQIAQLAPSSNVFEAARTLAAKSSWPTLNRHPQALWAECKGSGKNPYSVIVIADPLAFRCSCPSFKIPCKHALGLLLLQASSPERFTSQENLPADIQQWIDKREAKKAAPPKQESVADPEAQKQRKQRRESLVSDGIAEFKQWVEDIFRIGMLSLPKDGNRYSRITARLIDSQAAGLAKLLNRPTQTDEEELRKISQLYALCIAYQQSELLPPHSLDLIRSLIGWTTTKEEILKNTPVEDHWQVLSHEKYKEGPLTVEQVWLWGHNSQRFALSLSYSDSGASNEYSIPANLTSFRGSIVYHNPSHPQRCLVTSISPDSTYIAFPEGVSTHHELMQSVAKAFEEFPLSLSVPVVLRNYRLCKSGDQWLCKDHNSIAIPISNDIDSIWRIAALTLGEVSTFFALYEHKKVKILSILKTVSK